MDVYDEAELVPIDEHDEELLVWDDYDPLDDHLPCGCCACCGCTCNDEWWEDEDGLVEEEES